MWPERHEYGGILPEPPLTATLSSSKSHRTSSSPGHVAPPGQLNVHRRPGPPVGRIIPGRPLLPLVGELVAEVVGDVAEVGGLEGEGFGRFGAGEGGGGGRKAVGKGAAEAPREQLVAEESTGLQHAGGHHSLAEVLAALDAAAHNEDDPLDRVSFSYNLRITMNRQTSSPRIISSRARTYIVVEVIMRQRDLFSLGENEGLYTVADVVEDKIIQTVEDAYLYIRTTYQQLVLLRIRLIILCTKLKY